MSIATNLAHHHPALPPPIEDAGGDVWYGLGAHIGLDVCATLDRSYMATLTAAPQLNLARPVVAAEAATPEAAVSEVIEVGGYIFAAAAQSAAEQASTLATTLGTILPISPKAACERVEHLRCIDRDLTAAAKSAEIAHKAAQEAHERAKETVAARAALPGLRDPKAAQRVALLRDLVAKGRSRVDGVKARWLAERGLIIAERVQDERWGRSRTVTYHTKATITPAGRRALTLLDTAESTP